jgi:DNA-binding NtrC family response regulator
MKSRILCIDDDPIQCELVGELLQRCDYTAVTTTSPRTALDLLAHEQFDAILTDIGMAEMDGLALCEQALATAPGVPVIVVTGQGSLEVAVGAIRAGAYDFLVKPLDAKLLSISLARAVQNHQLRSEVDRLRHALAVPAGASGLVGNSPAMRRLDDLISRVGASEVSVLITGETGTGKELVARGIHAASGRRGGPFVGLNCAAVPPALLESELFGHARGAFTDAKTTRRGLFVEASGGALFLDEIGEMPLEMQAKLLRALQERRVRPVGSNVEVEFDTRIIAATNRDLEAEIREKRFRQDLYYRINVVRVDVPPLRDRGSDVLTLASFFLEKAGNKGGTRLELSPAVAERLLSYDWPGNVRELENCVERAVALARFGQLSVADLPDAVRAHRPDRLVASDIDVHEIVSLEEIEKRYIHRVLRLLDGNKARAAQLLGLDRRTLYRKLEKYQAAATDSDAVA